MNINYLWRQKWPDLLPHCLKIDACCSICARKGDTGIDLCVDCESLLERLVHTDEWGITTGLCLNCGDEQLITPAECGSRQVGDGDQPRLDACYASVCEDCAVAPAFLTRILAPYRYEFPMDQLIRQMKYRENRQLARVLGSLLARYVLQAHANVPLPQMLIPVPLNRHRQIQRGFNQARDIASWCAKDLGIPVASHCVSRLVDTESLAGLSRAERQHRILGAFQATAAVNERHVAIVDDVLTTGSTARELARELYDTGASKVELWVLARTSRSRLSG